MNASTAYNKMFFVFTFSFGNTGDVATILTNLAARFSNEAQVLQLEAFYAEKGLEFESATIATAIADAKFNLQWADKHVPDIYNYMKAVSGATQLVSISSLLVCVSAVICLLWN